MKVYYLIIFLTALMAVNCSKDGELHSDNPDHRDKFSIREGKRLFIHYCSPCHGENGEGYGKYFSYSLKTQPPDFTMPNFLKDRNDEMLFLTISKGSQVSGKSNLCPPWGNTFRKEEIEFIIAFIKNLNEKTKDRGE